METSYLKDMHNIQSLNKWCHKVCSQFDSYEIISFRQMSKQENLPETICLFLTVWTNHFLAVSHYFIFVVKTFSFSISFISFSSLLHILYSFILRWRMSFNLDWKLGGTCMNYQLGVNRLNYSKRCPDVSAPSVQCWTWGESYLFVLKIVFPVYIENYPIAWVLGWNDYRFSYRLLRASMLP